MTNTRPLSKQPIPDHAKKVFSGVMFDVYQWQQKQFDGSFVTFEKLKRPDTVIVIPVTTQQEILVLHQEQPGKAPFICMPGGRIDPGETPEQAAARELLEETGYVAQNYSLWHALQPVSKVDWAIYTFIAHDCQFKQEQTLDSGEKIEIQKVNFEEFVDIVTSEQFADVEITLEVFRAIKNNQLQSIKSKLLSIEE